MVANQKKIGWNLKMALIYIYPIAKDVFVFWKRSIHFIDQFIDWMIFLIFNSSSSLCILDVKSHVVYNLNIFSLILLTYTSLCPLFALLCRNLILCNPNNQFLRIFPAFLVPLSESPCLCLCSIFHFSYGKFYQKILAPFLVGFCARWDSSVSVVRTWMSTFPRSIRWRRWFCCSANVCFCHLWWKLRDCRCMDLFLDPLLCSIGLHVWFCSSFTLCLLLRLSSRIWDQKMWYLQHCYFCLRVNLVIHGL